MDVRKSKIQYFNLNKLLIILFLVIAFCSIANAAPPEVDPSSFNDTSNGFTHFYSNLVPYVQNVIQSPTLTDFSYTLWKFFAACLLIWQLCMYAMRGLEIADLITVIFMITITRVLMLQYDSITESLWGWSEGFATGIQTATVGVGDEFFAPRYIWNLMTSFTWPAANFLFHPLDVFAIIILSLTSAALCVLGFFTSVWALWGYSLAKMIGFMFIPFILFERLSWLFDGWLRFFFGFLLFNVIAKANLMLVIIALEAYFQLPANQIPQNNGYAFVINSLTDAMGLLVFLFLTIVGLLSTGHFVRSIVSGSHTGMLLSGSQTVQDAVKSGAVQVVALMG